MVAREAKRGRPRIAVNRERVLRAAIELADERGIDALTMRDLGEKLDIEGASLYNHVASKSDLISGMADLVIAEIDVPSGLPDWREAMRRRAMSACEVFARHPWASALVDSRAYSGPGQLAYAEGVLATLLAAGFSPRDAANAFLMLDAYIHGFQRQQSSFALPEGVDASDVADELLTQLSPDAYPALVRIATDFAERPHDEAAVFALGLELLLDGLERSLGPA